MPPTPLTDVAFRPGRSQGRLYALVLVPALLTITIVAALAVASLQALSAVRAFSTGESLWSKARAEAVEALLDYGRTLDPADFRRFERALAVSLSDRDARDELDRPQPDVARAKAGLARGGNHPDDIEGMMFLYRRFGEWPMFAPAAQAWREGDRLIERLRELAMRVRAEAERGNPQAGELLAALAQVRALNGELVQVERRFANAMGELGRLVEGVLVYSLVGIAVLLSTLGFLAMRRALDERSRHERALQAAHERWMLAAEGGGLGLYDWDVDRDELHLDEKAAAMYGLAPGPGLAALVRRADLTAILHPDDLAGTREALEHALSTRRLFRARYRVLRPDGSVHHIEATGVMQQQRDGGGRMVGVVRDVTEEERQTDRARERDAAERAAQARMEFLSRLSHELRTPLNAILGFAQLMSLQRDPPRPPQDAERVRRILDSGEQLLALVDDVLDITSIDSGRMPMRLGPVDVVEIVARALEQVRPLAVARALQLQMHAPEPGAGAPLTVLADAHRLGQVLVNLLSNACKYNRQGGHVTVSAQARGERVAIRVQDTGAGLSHEDRQLLFQPFRRLPATAANLEGSGLGLFIVKSLVERMDGAVEVDSVPGEGSCFTVLLPAAPQDADVPAAVDQARSWS